MKIQKMMPIKSKLIANNGAPSLAMLRIDEAITLNGKLLAIGWTIAGRYEIGKKIPDKINCGNVNKRTSGRIDSWVLARLPRKKPTHKKINAPNKITP